MGLLDMIMPGPSKNPYGGLLSDEMYQAWRRRQMSPNIGRAGDFLTRAATGDYTGGQTTGGDGLLDRVKLGYYGQLQRDRQEARETKRRRASKYAELAGGHDPSTGITWDTGRQGPGHSGCWALPSVRAWTQRCCGGFSKGWGRKPGWGFRRSKLSAPPMRPRSENSS